MIISKSKYNPNKPKVTVVCCLHGNEKIGVKIYDYFVNKLTKMANFQTLLTNTEAIKENKRYIDTDLNRSFPGKKDGNYEERLAIEILNNISKDDYIIDVHSTVANMEIVAIVSSLSPEVRKLINLTSIKNIVVMKPEIVVTSLIGNCPKSISIEASREIESEMIEIIDRMVDNLQSDKTNDKLARDVYFVNDLIQSGIVLPDNIVNYKKINTQLGVLYPVFYGEKNYEKYKGFFADKKEIIYI